VKIGYLSADWSNAFPEDNGKKLQPGGSGWYRCHVPAAELARRGYQTVVAEQVAMSDRGLVLCDSDGNEHDDIDVIVMQRVMHEFAHNLVRIAQDGGQAVVNDIDDWYWGIHESNMASKQSDPNFNPDANREHYRSCIMASDMVTCSTPFLAEQISSWGVEVELVRNAIDIDRWTAHEQAEKPMIGWVGSTTHRSNDLETVAKPVSEFVADNDLFWYHGGWWEGYKHACELVGIPASKSRTALICSIYNYPNLFIPLDIGIVPLNMIPFNQAKSYIKGLEYAASGVPFVAQATDEYKILGDSGIGRVVDGDEAWRAELDELLDFDTRVKEAAANLVAVQEHDIKNKWQAWADAYAKL
jgi:glycosyltransferase involved in cell wall biosynthesis